jgi:hypothetical protein
MIEFSDHPLARTRLLRILDAFSAAGIAEVELRDGDSTNTFVAVMPTGMSHEKAFRLRHVVSTKLRAHDYDDRWHPDVDDREAFVIIDDRAPDAFEAAAVWAETVAARRDERRQVLFSEPRREGMAALVRRFAIDARSSDIWDRSELLTTSARDLRRARTFADIERGLNQSIRWCRDWIDRVGVISQEPGFDKAYAGRVQNGTLRRMRRLQALLRMAARHLGRY